MFRGNELIARLNFLHSGASHHSSRGSPSLRMRFQRRGSLARNVRCQGTESARPVSPSERLPRRRERRKDHSCPRSQAEAVWICESIPGISDRVLRSTRNPEINRAESLCWRGARAEPYPTCTTQAEQSPDLLRRRCTASAFRPLSECSGGGCPY